MKEIRWHARAGQGAKTAASLLAVALLSEGKSVHAFPEYGPERRGAPLLDALVANIPTFFGSSGINESLMTVKKNDDGTDVIPK